MKYIQNQIPSLVAQVNGQNSSSLVVPVPAPASVVKFQKSLSLLKENKILLVSSLETKELSQILENPSDLQNSICLVKISNELSFSTIVLSPLLYTLNSTLGEKMVIKMLCFVICQLNESIKVTEKMNASQILQVAFFYMKKYTHDTIDDFILALQTMKMETDFFRGIGEHHIYKALEAHFERKSNYFEVQNFTSKTKELENCKSIIDNVIKNSTSNLSPVELLEFQQKNGVHSLRSSFRLPKAIFEFSISPQQKKEYQQEYKQFCKNK